MASRSRARQLALQVIYQNHFSGKELEDDFTVFWQGVKADEGTRTFTERLARGVIDQAAELDLEISAYLVKWTLDRIVLIDRIILQIAFYELLHERDVPWKVVLDEAVVLGKMFSGDKSATFINGVLHAWATNNQLHEGEPVAAPDPAELYGDEPSDEG